MIDLMGYDTHAVVSAEAALAMLPAYAPHVVFSDIGMPGMSGHDLARAIRDGRRGAGGGIRSSLGKPVMDERIYTLLLEHVQICGTGC